jgi:hypothetical protein
MAASSLSRVGISRHDAFELERDGECDGKNQPTRTSEALTGELARAESAQRCHDIAPPNSDPRDFDVPAQEDHWASVSILLADAGSVLPLGLTATDALPPPLVPAKQAKFQHGPIAPPTGRHDHGFLGKDADRSQIDESKQREPTAGDRVALAAWVAKLRGAEILRPDLKDACAAYEHYLFGEGRPLLIDYERFVTNDPSGATVLQSALEDARVSAVELHDRSLSTTPPAVRKDTFTMVSDVVVVGDLDNRYPYPETENWQKALGGHAVWMEARVSVVSDPVAQRRQFEIDVVMHADDMYNFDPEKADIATGTPDEANGRFQEAGLAHEFLSTGTAIRKIEFSVPLAPDSRAIPADLAVTGGRTASPVPAPRMALPPPQLPQ